MLLRGEGARNGHGSCTSGQAGAEGKDDKGNKGNVGGRGGRGETKEGQPGKNNCPENCGEHLFSEWTMRESLAVSCYR